jgi:formylglycine-generating enzyme required for sulfatase activity
MPYTVYLSSTLNDLEAERQAVQQALGDECVVRHSYRASENALVKSCLEDVAACDLYIGILGLRYGYVPTSGFRNPKKLSITELEYQHAVERKKPRLIFIKDEGAITFDKTDAGSEEHPVARIRDFRKRAGDGADQRPAIFKTTGELERAVIKAFNDFRQRREKKDKPVNRERSKSTRSSNESVRQRYLEWLRGECEKVVLLGLNLGDRQNIRLGQVYVPALTPAQPDPQIGTGGLFVRPERQHDLLLERLGKESLYVPGAPGSGKSTFCRWVGLCVASGAVPPQVLKVPEKFEETLPNSLVGRFPLLWPLRQWASHRQLLVGTGQWTSKQLEDALFRWIDQARPGGLTAKAFREALEKGRSLLILDGVDEIPEKSGEHYPRRNFLTGLGDALPQWTRAGNRTLMTSRPYGVEDAERRQLALSQAGLIGLPRELQTVFVRRWYAAAEVKSAEEKARGLLEHLDGRSDLDELRPNPMLLTALCVKYDEGQRLPGDLYRLYDIVVDQVLYKRYITKQERDLARLRLAAVALAMHRGPREHPRTTPQAEVSFDEIDGALAELTRNDPASERGGIEASSRRESLLSDSGLLLPRENRRAAFYHMSFQEFLAAVRLGRIGENTKEVLAHHAATPDWRRTLRFLFCAIGEEQRALEDYALLLPQLEPDRLEHDANPALLLADCLEVAHARDWNLTRFADAYRRACDHALLNLAPPERAHLWRTLGKLGLDDRPGVGVKDGLPDIDWVEVPQGEFIYGEEKVQISLDAFRIARYPITNAQFQCFIEDGGYETDTWWRWLAERPKSERPHWNYPNHPRETVSWYEAMAFCCWLDARLHEREMLAQGLEVRLPTEEEWEKAARGTDGREFPWGNYESGYANIDDTYQDAGSYHLGQTTAVGLYPQGASPYGAMDMAGNVLEWCLSESGNPGDVPSRGEDARWFRGGCWYYDREFARCAFREVAASWDRSYTLGFRVVCGAPIRCWRGAPSDRRRLA